MSFKPDINVNGEVSVKSVKSALHGSPTTTLRQHLIRCLYDGTTLGAIDKIVLVDDTDTERDYTTTLGYSVSANQLTITASISITASYSIAKVRSYRGTTLYFETALASPIPVNNGDTVSVTLTITVNISGSLTYGTSSFPLAMGVFGNRVARVLGGELDPSYLRVDNVQFVGTDAEGVAQVITVTPTKSISTDGLSMTMSASITPSFSFDISEIRIRTADLQNLWTYSNLTVYVPANSTLNYSETVSA
jgi:hypothetical protein